MNNVTLLGIDLAKDVFQLHGVDKKGNSVLRKTLSRDKLLVFIANLPPCRIVMEACGSASYWARQFAVYGHDVKLISSQFVKPVVKNNKKYPPKNPTYYFFDAILHITPSAIMFFI